VILLQSAPPGKLGASPFPHQRLATDPAGASSGRQDQNHHGLHHSHLLAAARRGRDDPGSQGGGRLSGVDGFLFSFCGIVAVGLKATRKTIFLAMLNPPLYPTGVVRGRAQASVLPRRQEGIVVVALLSAGLPLKPEPISNPLVAGQRLTALARCSLQRLS